MKNLLHTLIVGGLIGASFLIPTALSAASGCSTTQLTGAYDAQTSNIGFRGLLVAPPTTVNGVAVFGFTSNPNSLSGNLPGLGRYYFDGTGNIIGVTAASSTSPAVNTSAGTYTVNVDCSGTARTTSGATYDLFLANSGQLVNYVRTDAAGGGELGTFSRAGSCVSLTYPGGFTFAVGGGSSQTPTGGAAGNYANSTVGTLNIDGSGNFTLAQSAYTVSGITRSTASGTYTLGGDCSVTLRFSTTTGANSANFVAPTSFRFLMVDANTGLVTVQPDANTTLNGSVSAQ